MILNLFRFIPSDAAKNQALFGIAVQTEAIEHRRLQRCKIAS